MKRNPSDADTSSGAEPAIRAALRDLIVKTFGIKEDCPDAALSMSQRPEWDSLAHVQLLVEVQNRFGIAVAPEEIFRTLSLEDLSSLVASRSSGMAAETRLGSSAFGAWGELLSVLWERGGLRDDDAVYIHSRVKRLQDACGEGLEGALRWLRGPHRSRTLVFPAFPFSSRTYASYLRERPRFVVRATASKAGLLSEMIRRSPEAARSRHPVFSECAVGPRASWIVGETHAAEGVFHPQSSTMRLLELDGAVMGLGVDVNTNAFIHLVDDRLQRRYPFPVFEERTVPFEIEQEDGTVVTRSFRVYRPDIPKRIRPRNLRPFFKGDEGIVKEMEVKGVWFYRIRLAPFLDRCQELAERALRGGRLPPWYDPEARVA